MCYCAATGETKYMYIQLSDGLIGTTVVVVDEEVIAKQLAEKQQLESDVELLSQIIELSSKLITPHEVCMYAVSIRF